MITHFMKRDLAQHKIPIAVSGVITLLIVSVSYSTPGILPILLFVYFMLALVPVQGMIGSKWRSQHTMSRHYLLSLPVSRAHMFTLIQVRSLIFQIPFLSLSLILLPSNLGNIENHQAVRTLCLMAAILCFGSWFVNTTISQAIAWESIGTYERRELRFLRSAIIGIQYIIESLVFLATYLFFTGKVIHPTAFLLVPAFLTVTVYRYLAAKWAWLEM